MFAIGTVISQVAGQSIGEEHKRAFRPIGDFTAQENFSGIFRSSRRLSKMKELMAFRKLSKENEEINVTLIHRNSLLLEGPRHPVLLNRSSLRYPPVTAAG